MIGKNNLNFKQKKLFKGEEDTGFSVEAIVDGFMFDHKGKMWRVRWPDGVLSKDYYNLSRARDHAARLYAEGQNKAPGSPADAFNGGESYPSTSR